MLTSLYIDSCESSLLLRLLYLYILFQFSF